MGYMNTAQTSVERMSENEYEVLLLHFRSTDPITILRGPIRPRKMLGRRCYWQYIFDLKTNTLTTYLD